MKNFEFDWQSRKQTLRGKCWLPDKDPKAMACIIHGFGEHVERYNHVAKYFANHEIGLIGFDLIGHGKSDGKRGVVKNYELLMQHIAEFLLLVKEKFKGVPIILYGHSMGGNLVASFVMNYKPDILGTIITSPWIKLAKEPLKIEVVIGELIGSIIPGFTSKAKLDVKDLSTDLKVGQAYSVDPLVHNRMSAGLFVGVTDAGEKILKDSANITPPVLWMHGEEDKITSHLASQKAVSKNEKIDFKLWNNMRHELHNETKKEDVLDEMVNWMYKQIHLQEA